MPDDIITAIVRGTHAVFIEANADFNRHQRQPNEWAVTGPFDAPRVALVDRLADDQLLLRTDMSLREAVAYTITLGAVFDSTDLATPQVVTGKRRTSYERPREQLIDMAASPFEDYELTANGDIARRGGFATLRKIVLDTLLVPIGSLYWAPGHGTNLRHKKQRPASLRDAERLLARRLAAISGVNSATVSLDFNNGHMIARISVLSDFGNINERVDLAKGRIII